MFPPGDQGFASVLLTGDSRWATNSPDMIAVSVGFFSYEMVGYVISFCDRLFVF